MAFDPTNRILVEFSNYDRPALDAGCHDFDLLDKKGRKIGYRFAIYPITITEIERDGTPRGYYTVEKGLTGERVRISSSVTRAGKDFGAAQSYNDIHADLETARREVLRRAEAARKRYARKPQDQR